jgi:beta-lactamase superfamily II metal-dependent hydrolase
MRRSDHQRNILLGLALTAASVMPALISPGPQPALPTAAPTAATATASADAQPLVAGSAMNGRLQIHFIDVGQGDGALLISPQGETVLFDNGKRGLCGRPVSYLQQLGISRIDYQIVSHYHDDHIGCTKEVLDKFPLQVASYDRGGDYDSATYRRYVEKVGTQRKEASPGTTITLDSGSANPVTIEIVALNGNGVVTTNENDLSVVAVVHFGNFDAVIAGDLSGFDTGSYEDIETAVGPKVGQVEVYKVNHHGSSFSSNDVWLTTIKPRIGVISTATGNTHGHPTQDCLERLHTADIKTYWTESGAGVDPEPGLDFVSGGSIVVQNSPGNATFTVTYGTGQVDSYLVWGGVGGGGEPGTSKFSWSKNSSIYHLTECVFVKSISPANLQKADTPPPGKTLHVGCPK